MKAKLILILVGAIAFLQSCAPAIKMAAVSSSDQKVGYDGTIVSQKRNFVSLSPYNQLDVAKDKTMFMLVVQNGAEESFNISKDDLSVVFEGNSADWASKKINIQSLEDFMGDLSKEYSAKEKKYLYSKLYDIKSKLELQLMMSSSSSSSSSTSSLSSSSSSSGSSSSSDDDSAETMMEDLNYDIEIMRANNELLRQALEEVVIRPQSVMPGNSFSGIVVCDTRAMNKDLEGNFKVVVSVGGEEHKFTFNRSMVSGK